MDVHYNSQRANFYFFCQTVNNQLKNIFAEVQKAQNQIETPNKS